MIKPKKNQLEIDYSVILDIPTEKIDLVGWIRNFNADEYRACTPATGDHKAMIAYCDGEGENIYRNDERCGPVGMVQLYREAEMERDHIFLVSPATRGVLFGFWPMQFQITWDLRAEPCDGGKTKFTCRIGTRMNPLHFFLAIHFIRFEFFGRAHCEEETPHFANYAARWSMRNDPDRRDSYLLS